MTANGPAIETRCDRRRGCGWRKPGGLYLMADGPPRLCAKLPIPLDVCPTCGTGIKPSRGWTWVNGTALAGTRPCPIAIVSGCLNCPLATPIGRCGLLWIGGQYYPTPDAWLAEGAKQGISRRVAAIPKGFRLGRTWVMVAHRRAILNPDGSATAAVFQLFRPQAVEYVVRDDDSPATLARLAGQGVTLVRVERVEDTPLLPATASAIHAGVSDG